MPPLRVGAAIAIATAAALPASAGAIVFTEPGVDQAFKCSTADAVVRVLGNDARLRITGPCRRVTVVGSTARIDVARTRKLSVSGTASRISAGVVDRIVVPGSQARVTYRRASDGGAARVTVLGDGSKVRRQS